MKQEEKDHFDACMKMVDFRMKRIESRRQHEWKVTVAVWALLAAGILNLKVVNPYLLASGLIVLCLVHLWWIRDH